MPPLASCHPIQAYLIEPTLSLTHDPISPLIEWNSGTLFQTIVPCRFQVYVLVDYSAFLIILRLTGFDRRIPLTVLYGVLHGAYACTLYSGVGNGSKVQ